MFTSSKSQTKYTHKSLNIGVIIIFIIVTVVFAFSLSQSIYGKKIFNQKTELSLHERIVSLK